MFAVANKVDSIHMRPWIGFQSWRAAGRKVVFKSSVVDNSFSKLQLNYLKA